MGGTVYYTPTLHAYEVSVTTQTYGTEPLQHINAENAVHALEEALAGRYYGANEGIALVKSIRTGWTIRFDILRTQS